MMMNDSPDFHSDYAKFRQEIVKQYSMEEQMRKFTMGFGYIPSGFRSVEKYPPPLHEYVLVRKDGYITITRWRDGRWDINNDRTPWFTKDDRIRQNVQADEWMPLPGVEDA